MNAADEDVKMPIVFKGSESIGAVSKSDEKASKATAAKHSLRWNEAVAANDPESPEQRESQESRS